MRILFLSTNLPIPPNNGQAIRSLSIIRALASSGNELHFVSFAGGGRPQDLHPLSSYCREIILIERSLSNVSQNSDYLQRAACLLSFKPYSFERFRHEPMRASIQHELAAKRFDLILCDNLYALANVPETDMPIALNCHNVEHLIFQRYAQIERNVFNKFYAILETLLMRGAERRALRRAALAIACSTDDRDILHRLYSKLSIFVVPNAVDTDWYEVNGTHAPNQNEQILLFLGSMDWYPNRDAVDFFARTILPLVRAEYPGVRFVVAGRNPAASFVRELVADCGVEFTGTIPDIRPYLSAATVVVVPIRMGSGTRIKILEAGAAGKPIVSTAVGAEGLALESEKEIIFADEPIEFAGAVIALLRDPARRTTIGNAARTKIGDRYGYAALKTSLDKALGESVSLGGIEQVSRTL